MKRLSTTCGSACTALVVYHPPGPAKRLVLCLDRSAAWWAEALGAVGAELRAVCGGILRGVAARSTLRRIGTDAVILTCVSLCLACFCASREGGADLYMSSFLPFLGILILINAFAETLRSSRSFMLTVSLLILTGSALQTLLKLPASGNAHPTNTGLVLYAAVSTVCGLMAVPFISAAVRRLPKSVSIRLLNAAILGLYVLLLAFGRSVNGTRAWIYLGPVSFQVTEAVKLLSLIAFALAFTNEGDFPPRRLFRGLFTLLVNVVFLLAVNEFGTLCVILAGFFFLAFVYDPSLLRVLGTLGALAALLCGMLLGCFVCRSVREALPEGTAPAPVAQGARIYDKFRLRMDLMLHPETVDRNDGGYQMARAKNAILLSDWLGSRYDVSIPVVESDYIFDYLLLRMGVPFGILVLLLTLCMYLNAAVRCLWNPCVPEGAAGAVLVFAVAFQSLLAAASAMGQFLTVGIPFAFLAYGGSSTLINYIVVLYAAYVMRTSPEPKQVRRVFRR